MFLDQKELFAIRAQIYELYLVKVLLKVGVNLWTQNMLRGHFE